MPGVISRCLPWASAAFMSATVVPALTMRKFAIGIDVPAGFCASQLVACASRRTPGTNTCQAPAESTCRNGFSRTTGDFGTEVTGGVGKVVAGALAVPTNTMFQLEPTQLPSTELRVTHCCWVP